MSHLQQTRGKLIVQACRDRRPWLPSTKRRTLYDVFKSVADLCFTESFAVLGKAKYQYGPLRACRKTAQDRQTDPTKQFLPFDLEPWPTTLIYNPSLAKVKVDPHTKNQGRRSNGSDRRARTDKQTHRQTNGRYCCVIILGSKVKVSPWPCSRM